MLKSRDLEKKIILQLLEDGRQPLLQIAKNVGATRQTVAKKLEQLCSSGLISSFAPKLEPEKWHKKAFGGIDFIFWTIEIIAVILMVLAFIAITLSHEGVHEIITAQTIQAWCIIP